MDKITDVSTIPVGVVGLGLMGCSISTCLVIAGHPVIAVAPLPIDLLQAEKRIQGHLIHSKEHGLINQPADFYFKQLNITEDYNQLKDCQVIIECTLEEIEIKKYICFVFKLLIF